MFATTADAVARAAVAAAEGPSFFTALGGGDHLAEGLSGRLFPSVFSCSAFDLQVLRSVIRGLA